MNKNKVIAKNSKLILARAKFREKTVLIHRDKVATKTWRSENIPRVKKSDP